MTETITIFDAAGLAAGVVLFALAIPRINAIRVGIMDRIRVKRRVRQVIAMIPLES